MNHIKKYLFYVLLGYFHLLKLMIGDILIVHKLSDP